MFFAAEPGELALGVLAGGLLDRVEAFRLGHFSLEVGADFAPAEGLAGGWADFTRADGGPDFVDHTFGEHGFGAAVDPGPKVFARAIEDDAGGVDGGDTPLLAEAGETASGQEADFEGADDAATVLEVDGF